MCFYLLLFSFKLFFNFLTHFSVYFILFYFIFSQDLSENRFGDESLLILIIIIREEHVTLLPTLLPKLSFLYFRWFGKELICSVAAKHLLMENHITLLKWIPQES